MDDSVTTVSLDDDVSKEDLFEKKKHLDEKLRRLRVAQLTKEGITENTDDQDDTDLHERLAALQCQLLEESNNHSRHELLIERTQMTSTLSEELFTNEPNENEALRHHTNLSLQELELASQVKRILKETIDQEEKLNQIKQSNHDLQEENNQLMEQLNDSKSDYDKKSSQLKKDPEYRKLKDQLENACLSLQIKKHITQLVIMNSGADVLADEELQDLLIESGKPLQL